MSLFRSKKTVKPGTFISVGLWYGNGADEVIQKFLSNGWKVSSTVPLNYQTGNKRMFITFEAGSNANEVTDVDTI